MKNLKKNGYIIQRRSESNYCGVEGDNWYLNYCSDKKCFEEFYNANIDKSWSDLNYVDCCSDVEYIRCYINESLLLGIKFNILLCSTNREKPILEKSNLGQRGKVLGYDYAYAGGSYYSCILNDIISGRIEEFKQIHLNENGLFDSYEEVEEFIMYREKIKNENQDYIFEEGDFIIYKITEVCI